MDQTLRKSTLKSPLNESICGSRGRGYGVAPHPPFQISKIKESNNKAKNRRESSWKGRKEKEFHVCLVFMCTRVDTCIKKHFFFKIFPLNPPPPLLKNSGSAPGKCLVYFGIPLYRNRLTNFTKQTLCSKNDYNVQNLQWLCPTLLKWYIIQDKTWKFIQL